jgi:hypothetical protein
MYLGNDHEVGKRVHGGAEVIEIEHLFTIQIVYDVANGLLLRVELLDQKLVLRLVRSFLPG